LVASHVFEDALSHFEPERCASASHNKTAESGLSGHDDIAGVRVCGDIRRMRLTKLHPELRALTGQVGDNLSDLAPVSGSFCHTIRAEIGARGEQGADAFEFEVCSPEWLEAELNSYPILHGGRRLITKRFNPVEVEEYVRKRLLHASGPDWETVVARLGQWLRWEFENYES